MDYKLSIRRNGDSVYALTLIAPPAFRFYLLRMYLILGGLMMYAAISVAQPSCFVQKYRQ